VQRYFFIGSLAALCLAGCGSVAPEDSAVGDYLGGRLAASARDVDNAASAFSEAQAEAPGAAQVLRDAFFFNLAAGDIEKAIPLAERLASMDEPRDDGLSQVVLAAHAVKTGRYARARRLVADGASGAYLNSTAKIIKVWAVAGLDGPDAAARVLNNFEEGDFKGFNPLHEALLAEKAGRVADARSAYQIAVMTSGERLARRAYGALLERAGEPAAALEYYDLLAKDPRFGRPIARRGVARLNAGVASARFADTAPAEGAAIAFYGLGSTILEQAANQRAVARRAGLRIVEDANYNLPLVFFQLALYLDPELEAALLLAGSLLNVYGEHEEAVETLARIEPASPYFEQAQTEIAGAFNALDRPDEAISTLKEASRQEPDGLELRLSLANLYAARERHREAVKTLDVLIARLPEEPEADAWRYYLARGAALLLLDAWPRAEGDLKRAVALAPEEPTALNYLGYSWAERGENLNEAFKLIEKAIALQPTSGPIIDSLGWAHYQLERYEEAVGHLEQAAALEPADPTITDHLGDVYWRLGRELEARYQWRRVLELEPALDLQARVEQKLVRGLTDADE